AEESILGALGVRAHRHLATSLEPALEFAFGLDARARGLMMDGLYELAHAFVRRTDLDRDRPLARRGNDLVARKDLHGNAVVRIEPAHAGGGHHDSRE